MQRHKVGRRYYLWLQGPCNRATLLVIFPFTVQCATFEHQVRLKSGFGHPAEVSHTRTPRPNLSSRGVVCWLDVRWRGLFVSFGTPHRSFCHTEIVQIMKNYLHLTPFQRRIQGGSTGMRAPLSTKCLHFHAVFGKKNGQIIVCWLTSWCPGLGNPASTSAFNATALEPMHLQTDGGGGGGLKWNGETG